MRTWIGVALLCVSCTEDIPDTSCSTAFDVYQDGIAAQTSSFQIEIVDAAPNPPNEGDNSWRLRVMENGTELSNASVVVEPWMPAHGHGVSPATYESVGMVDGAYQVPMFNLIMPGVWEFLVTVEVDGRSEQTAFTFCAEG